MIKFLLFLILTISFHSHEAFGQESRDVLDTLRLVASRNTSKKKFSPSAKWRIRTSTGGSRGYIRPFSKDSLIILFDKSNSKQFKKIAVSDIISVKRAHSDERVFAIVGYFAGYGIAIVAGFLEEDGTGDFSNAIIGTGVVVSLASAVFIPVSIVSEIATTKRKVKGWEFQVE